MISKSVSATYDGKVFTPVEPIDLEPNTTYELVVVAKIPTQTAETAWEVLDRMTGTAEGHEDSSAELDHYLYGTPKRGRGEGE